MILCLEKCPVLVLQLLALLANNFPLHSFFLKLKHVLHIFLSEMLLMTAGVKTFTACLDTEDNVQDIQTAITTIKKHNAFKVILDVNIQLLPNFFKECRYNKKQRNHFRHLFQTDLTREFSSWTYQLKSFLFSLRGVLAEGAKFLMTTPDFDPVKLLSVTEAEVSLIHDFTFFSLIGGTFKKFLKLMLWINKSSIVWFLWLFDVKFDRQIKRAVHKAWKTSRNLFKENSKDF